MIPYTLAMLLLTQGSVVVEVEESVTTCEPPGNGAGPFWCYGSPLIVRHGDDVFVDAMETGKDIPLLCNTRWRLFRKHHDESWEMVQASEKFDEREPCPLVGFSDGRLFLSVNPSTQPSGTKYGACDPHLLEFSATNPGKPGTPIYPVWNDDTFFTDHSYRGIAVDGEKGEILSLNIHARSGDQYWSFRDESGNWNHHGQIKFPIRSCYPQVALKNKAGHILAIGDIVEPNEEWRSYKLEKTGASWDYVFRRLFYVWSPDVTKKDFSEPIEVDELEATAGYILNLDLWIDNEGQAHLLYLKQTVQSPVMRDKFFPNLPITKSLEYVVINNGEIVKRTTLFKGGEGASTEIPGYARFHISDNGRLFVVYYRSGKDDKGNSISENRLFQVLPEGDNKPITIPLQKPFGMFFTAIQRGGSKQSDVIDLYGPGSGTEIRYARVKI